MSEPETLNETLIQAISDPPGKCTTKRALCIAIEYHKLWEQYDDFQLAEAHQDAYRIQQLLIGSSNSPLAVIPPNI